MIDILSKVKEKYFIDSNDVSFSIGITTFEARFDKYFTPLINKIREYDKEIEIIVAVNGEHKREFGESFRKDILNFIGSHEKVFPIFFPRFRGLSKLWNSLIIHASNEHVLILNDDVMINDSKALNRIKKEISNHFGKSFIINNSWSHYLINRKEIDEVGYFDERLLGIGEEDGDLCWRYINLYGRPIANVKISGFLNFAQDTMAEAPINIQSRPEMKYSAFNRSFITTKYEPDDHGIKGMFDRPVILRDPGEKQYPNEKFFHQNKEKL